VVKHNHPGGAYSYRFQDTEGKVVGFCTDIEHGERIDPPDRRPGAGRGRADPRGAVHPGGNCPVIEAGATAPGPRRWRLPSWRESSGSSSPTTTPTTTLPSCSWGKTNPT